VSQPPYTIRLARPEDVPSLAEIEDAAAEIFRDTPVAGDYLDAAQPIEKYFDAQRAAMLWVAVAPGGGIAGFALARLIDDEPHLEELDVHPEHGRRGIGAALVRVAIEWARGRGARGLTLSTFRDIPWNGPFYATFGFRALDTASLPAVFVELRKREAEHGLPIEERVVMRLALARN
jgi:GNAT superfamily N-acetyltransferase